MATAPLQKSTGTATSRTTPRFPAGLWILNRRLDLLLFVSTPLLIAPLVLLLQSPWVGVDVATISLCVTAFGALGHHLPGMIRAYGDRDLFRRFRIRFILAPPLLLLAFVPLARHTDVMMFILLVWATWHALMQVYGFVRIYDVKVGCRSTITAYWDWLMCVCWFLCAQVFSNGRMAGLMDDWYKFGGPLIQPNLVHTLRWVCLAVSIGVLAGFLINHAFQSRRGPAPNPAKLLMLASGIGFWWFAMVYLENLLLGIALFEIFHDVQYLAIVWLYNCRRVGSNPDVGGFMKFLFRGGRGMLALYVGLVFAYGLVGLVPHVAQSGALKTTFLAVIWTSTILHYYYDGFIWKVRERSTQAGLGLGAADTQSRIPQLAVGGATHLLKWSPLIFVLGWLFVSDLSGASGSPGAGTGRRAPDLATEFARVQSVAAAVPGNPQAQMRAAVQCVVLGRKSEAIELLEKLRRRDPSRADCHQVLGEIFRTNGELDKAAEYFRTALTLATTPNARAAANHGLGQICLSQRQYESARAKFREALRHNPQFEPSRIALGKMNEAAE